MLLELGRQSEARVAYESALARSPNRLNALYGAGYAPELAGDADAAARFYEQLVEVTVPGASLPQLRHAREFLAGK